MEGLAEARPLRAKRGAPFSASPELAIPANFASTRRDQGARGGPRSSIAPEDPPLRRRARSLFLLVLLLFALSLHEPNNTEKEMC